MEKVPGFLGTCTLKGRGACGSGATPLCRWVQVGQHHAKNGQKSCRVGLHINLMAINFLLIFISLISFQDVFLKLLITLRVLFLSCSCLLRVCLSAPYIPLTVCSGMSPQRSRKYLIASRWLPRDKSIARRCSFLLDGTVIPPVMIGHRLVTWQVTSPALRTQNPPKDW